MSCRAIQKLITYLLAFILSTFAGSTMATNNVNITQHPLIHILQESFQQWKTLKQPSPRLKSSTGKTTPTIPLKNFERLNKIEIRNEKDINEDFPSYDYINNYSVGEKRICKRYFTNDIPKKKTSRRKSIYYIDMDSEYGRNILKALPEIYGKSRAIKELKSSNFLSLPNKRSPNIKVLTIDLVPKGDNPIKSSKKHKTQEIDQNSLLNSKMGKGEFLILIQQPKNQANINNLLEEMASMSVKKDTEENGEDSALNTSLSPQPTENTDSSIVPSAVGKMLKLFIKSDAYYKDLSSRLNNIYTKIVETKLQ